MTRPFKFDPAFCYSGCDGAYLSELLPAQPGYWFIAVLGQGYLATGTAPFPTRSIQGFLRQHRFRFDRATWHQEKSPTYFDNPFLLPMSSDRAIAAAQSGSHSLPLDPKLIPVRIFQDERATKGKKSTVGYVYFIITEDYQFVKIGFSRNPSSRLATLQATQPQGLLLLGSLAGTPELESALCRQFARHQLRSGWFAYNDELQDYIEKLLN